MNLFKYTRELFLLSIPIIIGQLGQMLIGAGDVYIASMYSTESVAAIGVANGLMSPFFLFGIGLMMGISPSVAQERGSDDQKAKSELGSIIAYSFITGLVLSVLCIGVSQFIHLFGFDEAIIPSMKKYIAIVAWSFPFAIVFQGIREYLQGFEDVFFPNLLSVIAVVLNLGLNYILVFGFQGFGGYGEIGLALASMGIRILLCLALLLYVLKKDRIAKVSFTFIRNVFKFSLPVASMFFLEVLAFSVVTLLSGKISVIAAATNNIIMNLASVSFMIPLSISSAVAVKVGYGHGKKSIKDILNYTCASLLIGGVFILIFSFVFFGFPGELMSFASKDSDVINLGIQILFVVALFQVADSVQVILSGVLRGLNSTKTSFNVILIGYWIIGIPVGYYLTFYKSWGVHGLWTGLAISLAVVALILSFVTARKLKTISFDNSH